VRTLGNGKREIRKKNVPGGRGEMTFSCEEGGKKAA